MKIYFSGSIRGGREDQGYYSTIIPLLAKHGRVLTEHIGDATLTTEGDPMPETEIFKRDMDWVQEADVLIAEVTRPSLGVGYEIGRAEAMGKPILCLFRPEKNAGIWAMIAGNPRIATKPYADVHELEPVFEEFFKAHRQ